MSERDDIYQKVILEHNRNPRFFSVPDEYTHHGVSSNPLCGDRIEVFFKVHQDKLEEVGFQGEGCAVCKSSASLLLTTLKGRSLKSAESFISSLDGLLNDDPDSLEDFGELKAFSVMRKFPTRFKCVKLSWGAASTALNK